MKDKESQKERILLVHNYYQIGGGEHTVFLNEKELLEKHGHDVIIYTRDNMELKAEKIKRIALPFSMIFSFKTYKDVKKIIRENRIDLVHCHNTFPLISPSVYYAANKCKIPVIQTVHNFRFICPNGVFFRNNKVCEECKEQGLYCSIKHGCYRNSKAQTMAVVIMLLIHRLLRTYKKINYIFLTKFNSEKFRPLLGDYLDKQYIKPNFEYIDLKNYRNERDGSYIFIGRLEQNKGIDFLISSWEIERDLYIFGSGALEDDVKQSSVKNPRIHYMGFKQQDVIFEYLSKASALLFPTDLYEGFPMTIVEAFALGTPVICSDVGNGADIVNKEKAGVSFCRRNKEKLKQAIQSVEENFEEYSLNAKTAFETQYNPEANYIKLKSIYEAVINSE